MRLNSGVFFIHIMKTAGTSFRRMLTENLNELLIYPNDQDLRQNKNGFYPNLDQVIKQMQCGNLRDFEILCGHFPFFLGELIFKKPRYIVFLREPVARTISMIEHRKSKSPAYRELSYEAILEEEGFVKNQLENYQTKVFAFKNIGECSRNTNMPLEITVENFRLALNRLDKVDVIGITEHFNESIDLIEKEFGFKFDKTLYANRGLYDVRISKKVRQKIMDINEHDLTLYEYATSRFFRSRS